jgi:hypothetical protein
MKLICAIGAQAKTVFPALNCDIISNYEFSAKNNILPHGMRNISAQFLHFLTLSFGDANGNNDIK